MTKQLCICLFCALAAVTNLCAAAGVYKWVDKDGKVHYTDQPPPTSAAVKVRTHSTPAVNPASTGAAGAGAAPTAPKSYVDQELEFRKRNAEKDEAEAKQRKADAEANERKLACAESRGNLRSLEEGGRVYFYDDKGEKKYMDDAERGKAIARTKQSIAKLCK